MNKHEDSSPSLCKSIVALKSVVARGRSGLESDDPCHQEFLHEGWR